MSAVPQVSVVIPTYRRRDNLLSVVAPLVDDPALHEVIVVVDGCDDGSLELLQDLAVQHPVVRPLWTENSGGAAARQTGIDHATGDVVLLLDDDVVAAPGLVSGHARHHQHADDLVVLGYMPTRLPPPEIRGRFATHLYAQEYEDVCAAYEAEPATILSRLWGGNVSVRRENLAEVPYHSGPFARSNHSDRDFGLRLAVAGLRGVFDRSLLSTHEHVRPLEAFLRDARRQGAGRALVHVEHPDLLGPLRMDETLKGLPTPLRVLVRLDRVGPLRTAMSAPLMTLTRTASRLGMTGVEVTGAKVLRRFETRRGIREVIPSA
ncbi:glycosyltransferase family 2 protein [Cellulomonas bogoriensis]|uniref:Glycosyltransferase 2-like domain-containing protein n=1 Tax=Cellulomonas bogoriensis 69B4 = DSM 16987 TaxID=1386082 RepID=A0A0A0BUV1_9CELL|nr:glycosyltransferase family 2 protein [Cellulomonas bogoriensis]KGM12173.1 hypothetical protein N869_02085 [Cellulomonas bogoriensis 69B4 = DSM 16987]